MSLTHKQIEFCKNIVAGLNGTDSYIKAYECKSKHAANVESTKLLKRDDITAYIKELRKPIINLYENTVINDRQQQIDFIKSRIQECIKKDDEQSLIRWNEQLNKIYNLYKEADQEQKTDNIITELDNNTLYKLTNIS